MMSTSSRSLRTLVLITSGWLALAATCQAGFPWSRAASAAYPKRTAYAPQMRHYAVVSPIEVPSTRGVYGGSVVWDETRPATPVYPWGWFGARSAPQPWTHTGFYRDYHDHAVIREQ